MTAVSSGRDQAATARRPASSGSGALWGAILALAAFGCSGAPPPPPPEPIDAVGVADNVRLRTVLQEPVRILFDWSLNESGSRTSGRGVVRMEPPYKARLDLFTGNGETVLRAALVDDVLRLPPGVESQEIVPPPALLWASLGVFRPGTLGYLNGGESEGDDQIRLSYGYDGGEEVRYHLTDDEVTEVELLRRGNVAEVVAIEASSEHPFPHETVYRNLGEFRELTLTLDVYEHVDVYPPDIWLDAR
jgi:hypothetical protein